jgi:syntaxin 5
MAHGRDRSLELYQIFDRLKAQGSQADGSALVRRATSKPSSSDQIAAARFYDAAGRFSKELSATSGMIGNLAKLMQNQTVFDDQAQEIASLTTIVKQRLAKLHDELGVLQGVKEETMPHGRGAQQAEKHGDTVVNTLRSKLLSASQGFKGVLQQRTKTLKENCSRRNQFSSDRTTNFESALFQRAQGEMQPLMSETPNHAASGGNQELQLAPTQVNYYRQRHDAVREVEAAVMQIGEMFQDFHRMVHEQEELVIRIDTDVDQAVTHVEGGISQLLIYLQTLSSNRGLILKIFAVLFVFILFFGFFVVR